MVRRGLITRVTVPPGERRPSAFARGPDERPLRIVLDVETATTGPAVELLEEFAHHDLIEVASTEPGSGMLTLAIDPDGKRSVRRSRGHPISVNLTWPGGRPWLRTAMLGSSWVDTVVDASPNPEATRRALELSQAAQDVHADVIATRDPVLVGDAWPRGAPRGATAVTPEEAVALVGLYLRIRGDFVYTIGADFKGSYDRGLAYWIPTRALLPAAWRWFSACVRSSHNTGDEEVARIAEAALVRFDRTLRARDRLQEQCQLPPDNNTLDEALFYLDVALLQLGGTFDAVARVARITYRLGRNPRPSWRTDGWLSKLAHQAPALASLARPGAAVRDYVDLTALLRNTIHEATLQGISFTDRRLGLKRENLVTVPAADRAALLSAARRRGGLAHWGIRIVRPDVVFLEPDRYIEALVPAAAAALNRLMAATEVERLPGLANQRLSRRAPTDSEDFSVWTRQRMRLLFGV